VQSVAVGGQRLRVAITRGPNGPGREPRIPLLLINGIGASLEALEPFVTALDGAVEVIRFDPPDIGGPARTDWAAASTALHGANHGGQRNGSSRGYFYQLGAVAGWTGVPFLPWLRQPALILAGDDDPIIPLANARLMHRLIRDSRLHVYPGGHLGLLTEAAILAPVVNGFLAGP
jgi:pimeloyl-ACP methyl ester carboxylesterase